MIKAIIFDLNGLFVQEPRMSDRVKQDFGVSTEEFLPVLKDLMGKARLPNAPSFYALWEPYLERWGMNFTEQEFFDYGFGLAKVDQELVEVAKKFKNKGLRLFILSNNFRERTAFYDNNFSFLKELFDKVYYSWQTGFVKPNPKAYQNLLKENQLQPEECIYFDDKEENVQIAKSLGIKSFIFEDAKETQQTLKSFV